MENQGSRQPGTWGIFHLPLVSVCLTGVALRAVLPSRPLRFCCCFLLSLETRLLSKWSFESLCGTSFPFLCPPVSNHTRGPVPRAACCARSVWRHTQNTTAGWCPGHHLYSLCALTERHRVMAPGGPRHMQRWSNRFCGVCPRIQVRFPGPAYGHTMAMPLARERPSGWPRLWAHGPAVFRLWELRSVPFRFPAHHTHGLWAQGSTGKTLRTEEQTELRFLFRFSLGQKERNGLKSQHSSPEKPRN